MRIHKQILSGLLVLCMILAMCPVIPFTAGAAAPTPIQLPTIGKSDSLAGMNPEGTNVTYLSTLHNTSNSLTINDRVVSIGNNTNIVLNGEYSSNLMPFVNGSRYAIKNHANTDANGYRTFTVNGQSVSYHYTEVALGYTGTKYASALGVHPAAGTAADRYIVYNVKGLGNRFYAVVGGTSGNSNNPNVSTHYIDFELWHF